VGLNDVGVDNQVLIAVSQEIRSHPVAAIGQTLRGYMTAMKAIV
jgi:ketol-acid reductoisomerase